MYLIGIGGHKPLQKEEKMAAQRFEITVPARFWDDHASRETEYTALHEAGANISTDELTNEVSRTGSKVKLSMNLLCIAELASDADYYATGMTGEPYLNGLIASAKATVRALAKAGYQHPVKVDDLDTYTKDENPFNMDEHLKKTDEIIAKLNIPKYEKEAF